MPDDIVPPVVETPEPISPVDGGPKDVVSYETHRRLLDEKKKLQARVDKVEADAKAKEVAELTAKGETQKLLELARAENETLKQKTAAQEERERQALKMSAIIRGLGGSVDPKWYGVVSEHLDSVIVNPDTGAIEDMSVTSVVENLKKVWPEMLKRAAPGVPQDAPKGNQGGMISLVEFNKLPSAEMLKYRPEQIQI